MDLIEKEEGTLGRVPSFFLRDSDQFLRSRTFLYRRTANVRAMATPRMPATPPSHDRVSLYTTRKTAAMRITVGTSLRSRYVVDDYGASS